MADKTTRASNDMTQKEEQSKDATQLFRDATWEQGLVTNAVDSNAEITVG